MFLIIRNILSYEHTERQAAAAASRSHWNALWHSKIGPRPIPKRPPKRQNFKAAARCVYTLICLRRRKLQLKDLNIWNIQSYIKLVEKFKSSEALRIRCLSLSVRFPGGQPGTNTPYMKYYNFTWNVGSREWCQDVRSKAAHCDNMVQWPLLIVYMMSKVIVNYAP